MVNPTTPPIPTSILGLPTIPIPPTGGEFIPIVQNGVTYRTTANTLGGVGPIGPVGPPGAIVPWAIATGTANIIAAAYSPGVTVLTDGLLLSFRALTANTTTTPTFQADSTTAHVITQRGGAALVAGSIAADFAEYFVRYNLANTRWELLNPAISGGVTTTGSPSTGNLAKFSSSGTIINADLSGDITTSGGVATTLATVNSNVGTFNGITVNAKGLVTAAANSGLAFISTQTASNSASVAFTSGINSSYTKYVIEISNLVAITHGVDFLSQFFESGSYVTEAHYRGGNTSQLFGWSSNGGSTFGDTTSLNIGAPGAGILNISTAPISAVIEFSTPNLANSQEMIWRMWGFFNNGQGYMIGGGGYNFTTVAMTGLQFFMSSGNIASGTFKLYGLN